MKKLLLSFLLGTVILSSCEKEDLGSLRRVPINSKFSSGVNEKVYVTSESGSLTLEVAAITDDRCKVHESCGDPGICYVRLRISDLDKTTAETILSIDNSSDQQFNETELRLDKKNYLFRLDGVNPKPFLNDSTTAKQAEVFVEELK